MPSYLANRSTSPAAKSLHRTRAVILAAAKPSFSDDPVGNHRISDERLLDLQVAALRHCGIDDIVVVAGHAAERLARSDIEVRLDARWQETGSTASLACARESFDGSTDVLVLYGDTVFSPAVLTQLLHSEHPLSLLCHLDRQNRDIASFREFAAIQDGLVVQIDDAPRGTGVRTVFTGLALIRATKAMAVRRSLEALSSVPEPHLGALFNEMIAHGVELAPTLIESGWAEVRGQTGLEELLDDPKPLLDVLPVRTDWGRRAVGYDRLQWVSEDALVQPIIELAYTVRPARVLDVGTGTGKILFALKKALPSAEFWGVDSSEAMLAKFPNTEGFILRQEDAHHLAALPSGAFDFVTARMVFHHLEDPETAVRSIARVMRPGGCFVLCEGVPPSSRVAPWYTEMFRYKEDRNTLTEGDLVYVLQKGGFTDINTRSVLIRRASLNNWLDNSGIPEENIRIIKEMHRSAPEAVRNAYDMEFTDDDCLMTWRFAFTYGRLPDAAKT